MAKSRRPRRAICVVVFGEGGVMGKMGGGAMLLYGK